jgi:nicotinamide-nucleotide amidase
MAGMESLPGLSAGELASRLLRACEARGVTLVTAESLTGGLIASTLSSIPGASRVLTGGFITYSAEMKSAAVGVDPHAIAAHGVVSEEVARSMAGGALACGAGPKLAIAVTGVAGPGQDADGTPAGTVHIACAVRGGPTLHRACAFGDIGREAVRARTVQHALDLALQALEAQPE